MIKYTILNKGVYWINVSSLALSYMMYTFCIDCMRKLGGLAQDEGTEVGYKGQIEIRQCLDHCILDERCKSLSYDTKNSHCYLKEKRVDSSTPKRYNTDFRTYYKICDGKDKT